MNPEKKKVVIGKELPDTSLLKKSFLEKYDVHIYENESSLIGAYAFLNNKALGKGHTNINKEVRENINIFWLFVINFNF
jgi:hypothetical protein